MANDIKIAESMQKLENALTRLRDALDVPLDEGLTVDATIRRFKFCIELFWRFLQTILVSQGVAAPFPKTVLQKSYAGGLIDDEDMWLKMINDRNLSSHTYDQVLAIEMYHRIENHYLVINKTLEKIKKSNFLAD